MELKKEEEELNEKNKTIRNGLAECGFQVTGLELRFRKCWLQSLQCSVSFC